MADLRIALVGCGGIGGVHARSWRQVAGARVVAACDPDSARAAAVEAPAAYTDLAELLAAERLDAVDLCTPPHLHAEQAAAVFARGLPLLCEKPLARNPEEAAGVVAAAHAARCFLMTAFCHRFEPGVEFVRGLIDDGKLGRVLMFRNRFGTRFTGVEDRWFSQAEISGGGALMDTSVHSVDLFRHLVGEVAEVRSDIRAFHPDIAARPGPSPRGLEDSAILLLTAESGALGVIEASWMTPWSANVVEIYGERGAAVIDYDTGETRYRLEDDAAWTPAPLTPGDRFVEELRHFTAVLREGAQPRVTGADGLRAVEVVYEAYRR
jgi:UDP-N-acetylglucosamine 3-dehydrogenase